jgi:hypothetical protein
MGLKGQPSLPKRPIGQQAKDGGGQEKDQHYSSKDQLGSYALLFHPHDLQVRRIPQPGQPTASGLGQGWKARRTGNVGGPGCKPNGEGGPSLDL